MMETEGKKYLFTPTFLKKMGVNREQKRKAKKKVVFKFPNRKFKEHMVDALTLKGDEGRSLAAISFGEVPSNL